MTAAHPLPFFGAPIRIVPPLEVTILARDTQHGTRYFVCAKDERGQWQPAWTDKFQRAIPYVTRDFAMVAYKRWKVKVDRQGVVVCFVESCV